MITTTMNKKEVNKEISRIIPYLLTMAKSKAYHRMRQSKKRGYPDTVSSYEIEGVKFWVFYFFDDGADLSTIFCRYHDDKGAMYSLVNMGSYDQYSILHFLKHAIDRYNERLELGLVEVKDIIFHMVKNGLTMVRQDIGSKEEDLLNVGWKGGNGLWLGESKDEILINNTHVNLVRTFIDDNRVRQDQEAVLSDHILEDLTMFEMNIGGDDFAKRKVNELLNLYSQ